MLTVNNLKLGLQGLTPTDLVEKGRTLVTKCTGNADLTLPATFLAALSAAVDKLEAANIAVGDNGGRQDRLARAQRVRDVEPLVRELAGYVQAQCGGDPEKITGTGFELRKGSGPAEPLPAPGNVRAVASVVPGRIEVLWNGVAKRKMYRVQHTTDTGNPASWKDLALTTRNRYHAEELASDVVHYFRIVAIGSAGESPVSDITNAKAA